MIPASTDPRASKALRSFAAAGALIGWAMLLLQLWLTVALVMAQGRSPAMALVLYFGYFTILTNLLAALVLSAFGAGPGFAGYRLATSPVAMTAVAGCITIVGAVYFLILRHLWQPQGAQFLADATLHYLMPLLFVLFWAWAAPARAVHWSDVPGLLVYPLAYLVYVFVRGEIVGLYPYDFVDVFKLGYRTALLNAVGLLLAYGFVVACFVGLKAALSGRGR
ncbi:Pr6Pr family membrane protein [Polaromonas sp. UC242_47]|uniref:Pr6Pr family membrane protein n=1 Tax=Polaromonas sp. UC242_47 TaxID=3374626 RepID=UPI0037B54FCD